MIGGDLKCMDENYDCATWYFTLSCNEYDWPDLLVFLKERNHDLINLDTLTFNELISIDPVSVSIFYEKKLRAFMS